MSANYDYSKTMTDEFGHPIPDNQNSLTAGPNGPILLQDYHLINKLAHFDRERIPERVVHAKGAGAHGYFEVTHDVTRYTKAAFLNRIGKRTPLFCRFSTVGGERGSADTARDPRGFAVKFYTEEGNYDMVGNNTPIFFIRDTVKFPDFIHTQKRNPQSNLGDPDAFWDFLSLTPESVHQVTILFSDRGTPYSYRHMNGYSSHTYKFVNKNDEAFWVKIHFKTETGIKNLTIEEAIKLAGEDPDHATRDLFNHIQNGGEAAWKMYIQVMNLEDAAKYRFDPFDVTKVWPHKDYPLIPVGRMVLNRNPENYFAETEQSAFSPANLVPGIEASPDKMLQGRLFSYNDTHRHRLGPNYAQIPINAPLRSKLNCYFRDGFMAVNGNGGRAPNYEPNSFGGPKEAPHLKEHPTKIQGTFIVRQKHNHPNDDFVQAGNLYRHVMTPTDRDHLIHNIVIHLKNARKDIQMRQVQNFYKADKEYGRRVAEGLGLSGNL
jgi:catalase